MSRLCSYPVYCLAWGVQAMEPIDCWVGLGLGAKMLAWPPRELMPVKIAWIFWPVSLSPEWATASPRLSWRPPRLGRSSPGSYKVTTFALGLGNTRPWYALQEWSLCFLQPSGAPALKCCMQCQTPSLGSLTWDSELSLPWEDFCSSSQAAGHPPSGYGVWLCRGCAPPTLLLWFFLYVFECRISFLVGSSVFFHQWLFSSCDFGVLMRGGELKVLLFHHLVLISIWTDFEIERLRK